ncbi:MAG TPA: START-like domain-containing protein [Bacteroidales bacterium]|nr:START-like domain-containing protein [Bacteroidales bacterium]
MEFAPEMNQLEKFTLEFHIEASPKLLFKMISTPEGLTRWFANTTLKGENLFSFKWHDNIQLARLVQSKENDFVVFQWQEDYHKGMFLEMRITTEFDSTGATLVVTDVAEPGEIDLSKRLWSSQVGQLKRLFKS